MRSYQLTIRRDEEIEASLADLRRAIAKLGRLIEEEGDAVNKTFYAMLREAQEEAKVHGPDSEASVGDAYRGSVFFLNHATFVGEARARPRGSGSGSR